jgi:hypothetical protein
MMCGLYLFNPTQFSTTLYGVEASCWTRAAKRNRFPSLLKAIRSLDPEAPALALTGIQLRLVFIYSARNPSYKRC